MDFICYVCFCQIITLNTFVQVRFIQLHNPSQYSYFVCVCSFRMMEYVGRVSSPMKTSWDECSIFVVVAAFNEQ